MPYPVNASRMRPVSSQQVKTVPFPAPSQGVNSISNLSEMTPSDAIYCYNMLSGQYGLRARQGYTEWCTNVGTGGIRTIIPYIGTTTANNRLFACTEDGIYDVSSSSASPSSVVTFPVADASSGYGIFFVTTNAAGAKFLCYTDETNGYYVYTEATTTWAKVAMGAGASEISGVDPATFCFVMSWKNRLWFIQKDTGAAWYLAVGSLFGTATRFEFGNKFKYGGSLRALYNWTVDGGVGVDDYLVGISAGGDVIVYQGTDPSSATTIDQRGAYYIGPPPAGRRIAGSFGGELFLLSSYGLIPITKLLSGQTVTETEVLVTARITPLVNEQMIAAREDIGWEVRFVPSQTLLMVSVPKQTGYPYIQFVQSLDTKGWSLYRDFPYETGDTWEGDFYFGDTDNRVLRHTGDLDDVSLGDPNSGNEINWSLLTSFQDFGFTGGNKVVQFIRPTFIGGATPGYSVKAVYDYNLLENTEDIIPAPSFFGGVWDIALWDVAVWGGQFTVTNLLNGAWGIGRSVAVALRGTSRTRTILVNFAVSVTGGNVL